VIDLETVHDTRAGTRFHRTIAILLGCIAVLAAALGAVQLHRSQAESRAATQAARLTADLGAGIPVQAMTLSMFGDFVQDAISRQMEGATRQYVGLVGADPASVAAGVAEQAAGERLADIATVMAATPDASSGVPPYELRLLTAGAAALQAEVTEQNRLVDVDVATASADSNAAVAGLSVLALAGVLVGLASVLGADRAGRATLLMAWLATALAALLLITALL
jgi:hypothetical protein